MTSIVSRTGILAIILGMALVAAPAFAQTATRTANFSQGDRIILASKVNVRLAPNGTIIGTQSRAALGTLVGGPINAAGYTWWKVDYNSGVDGWSAEDFMQSPNVALQSTQQGTVAGVSTMSDAQRNIVIKDLTAQVNVLIQKLAALMQAQTSSAGAH